jgi:rhamnosyl/mannosyltransferase
MNVTFVNKYYFPPHLGGVEQSLNLLARSLASREDTAVRAIVANEGRDRVDETLEGVRVTRVPRLLAAASTPIAPSLAAEIRSAAADTDVFHLQFPYPWGEAAWLAAGAPGPCVLTYHADVVRQRRLMAAYAPVLRRVLDRVDRIIVGAPQIAEHSPFLAPHAEKCRVVPFAIEEARFAPDPQAEAEVTAARAAIPGRVVLFLGRLVYYKGAHVLL